MDTITKKDWDDLIYGLEVYSMWSNRQINQGKSVSMGFTAESQTPKNISACSDHRAYEVVCPECHKHFLTWKNWYEAKDRDEELQAICEQGHIIDQRNLLVGKDITNEEFWSSLNKKIVPKPLTKRK